MWARAGVLLVTGIVLVTGIARGTDHATASGTPNEIVAPAAVVDPAAAPIVVQNPAPVPVVAQSPPVARVTPVTVAPVTPVTVAPAAPAATTSPAVEPFIARTDVLVDPNSFGRPWGNAVQGLLTFRGNPTRSYHGDGPVPTKPKVLWQYPAPGSPMCGSSVEYYQTRVWCGTGWTGQPAVFERGGRTWVVFGAYDYSIHFVDAVTGHDIIPPFKTGDLAKGNVTIDPDGYPLLYEGSRDNKFRVISFDGTEAKELWRIEGRTADRIHNDDWDAAALVLNDYLIEGGENSWFHIAKLNRAYAANGTVTVNPSMVARVQGWDDQLVHDLGYKDPKRVSLESSVVMSGDIAYLNNSGGLVQGWDLSSLRTGIGTVHRVFRFWTGDDSDSTIVADEKGFLYVGAEVDRDTARGRKVGQLLKLDPSKPDDPVVWSVSVNKGVDSGTWSTPAVYKDLVIWPTKPGRIYALDRETGVSRWTLDIAWGDLSSPSVVDNTLVQADAEGVIRAWDITNTTAKPPLKWQIDIGENVESSMAIWKGRIYVGSREGYEFCLGDA